MLDQPYILVIGASGRFLAQSAVLAKYQVSVIDLFSDLDTQHLCNASNRFATEQRPISRALKVSALGDLSARGDDGDGEILKAVDLEVGSASCRIVFSGGAENSPEFFRRGFWGASEVAGPSESSIERLLNWPTIKDVCLQHQIRTPVTFNAYVQNIDTSKTWLRKQIRSGGGLQIQPWISPETVDFDAGFYLQEKMEGTTVSGCYVACQNGDNTTAQLLGACQQLPSENPKDYRYQGSFGPVHLDQSDHQEMGRVGRCIAPEFSITGVFGIDFISNANGLHLIDINPRITASAELIERYYRRSQSDFTILRAHLDATMSGRLPTRIRDFGDAVFSKTIVYLKSDVPLVVDEALVEYFQSSPTFTDVPAVGTEIQPGHPLVSVHAEAENQQALSFESAKRVRELKKLIGA